MRRPFSLSWSAMSLIENCPQSFLWGWGFGDIDCGGGPGNKKPVEILRSEHHPVMGIAIQWAIERFYNDELWRTIPSELLQDHLLKLARQSFELQITRKVINWAEAGSKDQLWQTVRDGVVGYLRTMKTHQFLGSVNRAEVEYRATLAGIPLMGRADVVIVRPDTGVTILDGKNSKRKFDAQGRPFTYTDPDQLRYYALMHLLSYQKLPDRLGFVYYRYPAGNPVLNKDDVPTGEKEPGVSWVPCTREDVQGLAHRASEAYKIVQTQAFDPKPTPKGCQFCDYANQCPARIAQKEANKAKRAPTAATAAKKQKALVELSGLSSSDDGCFNL